VLLLETEIDELKKMRSGEGEGEKVVENEEEGVISQDELTKLQKLMDELSVKLYSTKGDLRRADLKNSLLEMQKCFQVAVNESNNLKIGKLEAALGEAKHELEGFQRMRQNVDSDALKLSQAEAIIRRQEEQLEFLLQVHDAGARHDWTGGEGGRRVGGEEGGGGEFPVGSPVNVARRDNSSIVDPVAELENMGFRIEEAIHALESTNGDLNMAILILTSST